MIVTLIRRLAAGAAAVVLVLAGVVLGVEVALALLGQPAWLVSRELGPTLARTPWSDAGTVTAGTLALLLGVLLLVLAWRRGQPRRVDLREHTTGVRAAVTSAGLRRAVDRSAAQVAGVSAASTRLDRGRLTVLATTPARDTAPVAQRVEEAAAATLAAFGPDRDLVVQARTTQEAP